MQTAARRLRQGLGHGAKHHAVLLRNGVRRQLEQQVTVGTGQRVVKFVVDLVLAAGVFVVDLLQLKAQGRQRGAHVLQKCLVAVDGFEVVRGFVELVGCIGHLPGSVGALA